MFEDIFGITINGVHTSSFGLLMESMYIPQPEPNVSKIKIPGMSGALDLSEVTGELTYGERTGIEFTFTLLNDWLRWSVAVTKIAMAIHGKSVKVILDNDKSYYYICRLTVDPRKSDEATGLIVLSGTADPYKYDLIASDEPWVWDTFNFDTGVIRDLQNVNITNDNQTVLILGGGKPRPVEITVYQSDNLCLVEGVRTYALSPGRYRFPMIRIGTADKVLHFTGNGRVSIKYRGAYL